jgi:hypothetical protein
VFLHKAVTELAQLQPGVPTLIVGMLAVIVVWLLCERCAD